MNYTFWWIRNAFGYQGNAGIRSAAITFFTARYLLRMDIFESWWKVFQSSRTLWRLAWTAGEGSRMLAGGKTQGIYRSPTNLLLAHFIAVKQSLSYRSDVFGCLITVTFKCLTTKVKNDCQQSCKSANVGARLWRRTRTPSHQHQMESSSGSFEGTNRLLQRRVRIPWAHPDNAHNHLPHYARRLNT